MRPSLQVFEDLIQLGQSREERLPPSLVEKAVAFSDLAWRRLAEGLPTEEIADLIRGLILYCRASGHQIGGSASPVILLYRILVDRAPSWEPKLTKWIVEHRTNPYEPFGTLNDGGATTHAEFVEWQQARAQRARANEAAELERQAGARKLRTERERIEATQRIAGAVGRGDLSAVRALVAKGADLKKALPEGESLVTHAEQNGRSSVAEYLRSLGTK